VTGPRRICLPWGFTSSGQKTRACCQCGYRTTPRANKQRALTALLGEHGLSPAVCALCERDYTGLDWLELRHHLEILTDRDEEFLVCRGMPRSCRDNAARRQRQLDREVADAFGIALPPPQLRLATHPSSTVDNQQ